MLTDAERSEVREHLERTYAGVFGPAEIDFHLGAHVGRGFADYACQVIGCATRKGGRVLDVGAGYGSFVLVARDLGFDAVGTEIAEYELAFSRRRLARLRPADDPESVFLDRGIFNTSLNRRRFDAITFWNVLEHIDDIRPVVRRATELLEPGGAIYVVCPNYAAWRDEAHYHVKWHPLLSRSAFARRLRARGKDPHFFETAVFLRSNWGVMYELLRNGLHLYDRLNVTPMTLTDGGWRTWFARPAETLAYFNPARSSIELAARKPS